MATKTQFTLLKDNYGFLHIASTGSSTESNVSKLDVSTVLLDTGSFASSFSIVSANWSIGYDYVLLEWDNTTDGIIGVFAGNGNRDYSDYHSLLGYESGGTNDLLLTTSGLTGSYDIGLLLYFT